MSKVKAGGTAKNLRDSNPKYLGTKLYEGQKAGKGSIIIRQRGSRMIAGKNVRMGKDHTLYAVTEGKVHFTSVRKTGFNGKVTTKKVVNII